VVWLIKGLGPGGAERLLTLSAQRRDRRRTSPVVVYLLEHKRAHVADLDETGVPVRCLHAAASWDPRWWWRLRRLLATERPDVVHSHSPVPAIGARLAVRTMRPRNRPRLVTTEHNVWESHKRVTAQVDAWTAGLDDAHVAVSEAVRDSMPPRLRRRTEVVRHGIDVQSVRARAVGARSAARCELGIADDEVLVVTVANLRVTKGYTDLLRAASHVVRGFGGSRFVAVGQGPDEEELRALHARLGLGDRFLFLGYRDDAVQIMAAADLFCLASRHEGLPLALMEALALGLPIVATSVGGIPELVTHDVDAILVAPHRPDDLAHALTGLVRDPRRRAILATRAREHADALDVERAVRRIEAIYREVTGGEHDGS
jgi:glycosyltransferase involved in cell wall biosynthesis